MGRILLIDFSSCKSVVVVFFILSIETLFYKGGFVCCIRVQLSPLPRQLSAYSGDNSILLPLSVTP